MDSSGYTMISVSRMRGPGTSFMIKSFLIQSRLATCQYSSWCGLTIEAGVHLLGSGGQRSAHICGKCSTKPVINWTIGGGTTPTPWGIKSIAPTGRQPAQERLTASVSVSLDTVAMIAGQRLSHPAAGSTSEANSRPLDHWIGMR